MIHIDLWTVLFAFFCHPKGGQLGARPSPPHRISLNKTIAEVGLTHVPCPLRQNHVIIHSIVYVTGNKIKDRNMNPDYKTTGWIITCQIGVQ
jgi:hypothetical protein